jgi:hypothetical protein
MPLTKSEGLKLSNDELLGGLLRNDGLRHQLAARLPFRPVKGDSLRVERSSASDYGIDPLFDTVPVTVTEGKAVPTASLEATFSFAGLIQDVKVNDFVEFNQSNVNSQVGVQLRAAAERLLDRFSKAAYEGDASANPEEFSGIRKLTSSGQTIQPIDTVNSQIELLDLIRLESKLKGGSGRPDLFYTSRLGLSNIVKAYHNKGLAPEYAMAAGSVVPSFGGVPVLVGDEVSTTETVGSFSDGTSIYAVRVGRGGLYGIVPEEPVVAGLPGLEGGQVLQVSRMLHLREVLSATAATTTYRLYWPVGLVLDREDGVARLQLRPMAGTT